MSFEDDIKNQAEEFTKKWVDEKLKSENLPDLAKKLAVLGTGFATGALVDLAFSLLNNFINGSKSSEVNDILKEISDKLDDIEEELGNFIFTFNQDKRSFITNDTKNARDAINAVLTKINDGSPVDSVFETLDDKLGTLNESLAVLIGPLSNREKGGNLWEAFDPDKYDPLTEWGPIYPFEHAQPHWTAYSLLNESHIVGWGLHKQYNEGAAADVPEILWKKGTMRPDYRAAIGVLMAGIVTALAGHLILDPAARTTGLHRLQFATYAKALQTLAQYMLGGIKIARSLEIPSDLENWYWGSGIPYWEHGKYKYHILSGGWPVGAIDTVTGAHLFHYWWRPWEHGYPILKNADYWMTKGSDDNAPYFWQGPVAAATTTAKEWAEGAWAKLALESGAFKIFELANRFEELSSPPDVSETVRIDEPSWSHTENADGTETLPDDEQLWSSFFEHQYTADVYRLRQRVTARLHIQPDIYRHEDANPLKQRSQRISYHYFLQVSDKSVELSGEYGAVTFVAPTFTYIEPKAWFFTPVGFTIPGADGSHQQPGASGRAKGSKGFFVNPVTDVFTAPEPGPTVVDLFAGMSGAGINATGGRWMWAGEREVTLKFSRHDANGLVTFTFEHEGPDNFIVNLSVREAIGSPPPGAPSFIETSQKLAFVGTRLTVDAAYFDELDASVEELHKLIMGPLLQAVGKPPIPDPKVDPNLTAYVTRVDDFVQATTGSSLRDLRTSLRRGTLASGNP